jgi:two-component system, NtrC family, nitrogen regulation response regulator GlnG
MNRILLIDDTPEIAELLTFALRDQGFDVVSTGFTGDVSELVARAQPDAIVLDCSAYQMSESVFDSIRGDDASAALPVVIISDTIEQADSSLRARDAQRVLLLPKPFTGSQVGRALNELLAVDGS